MMDSLIMSSAPRRALYSAREAPFHNRLATLFLCALGAWGVGLLLLAGASALFAWADFPS